MPNYFITGANRGLGLEFVRQISSDKSNTVLACTRSFSSGANDDLQAMAKSNSSIHVLECDTSSLSSISALPSQITKALGSDAKLDYLLNNAATNSVPDQLSLNIDPEALLKEVGVNVIGPAKVVETLQGFLKKGSLIMNMSSGLGSAGLTISDIGSKCTVYSISKHALNMLTVHQSFNLKEQGVLVICMDPGWVKTRMGGDGAILEPHESISGMLDTIHKAQKNGETAKYYTHSGNEIPW